MKRVFAVTAALALLCLVSLAQASVMIDTVPIGDAGNVADTRVMSDGTSGYGSVAHDYRIGKHEVTAGQYTAFLNAVATTDTYGLYNPVMLSHGNYGCGITQSGVSGSYSYTVAAEFADRPVNEVSWGDAARFANWLHNGQPTGAQNLCTTEDGAYFLNGATTDAALNAAARKGGWRWAIASEDEWYKAAYYKGRNTDAGYWLYPTSSDTAPGQDMSDASGNNANYSTAPYIYPIDAGKYSTVVGEFQDSDSPYGTFDQGGNVWEWNESVIAGYYRGVRGGSADCPDAWNYHPLRASGRYWGDRVVSSYEDINIGFRVVQAIPEPSSLIVLTGGVISLLGMRRRRA